MYAVPVMRCGRGCLWTWELFKWNLFDECPLNVPYHCNHNGLGVGINNSIDCSFSDCCVLVIWGYCVWTLDCYCDIILS